MTLDYVHMCVSVLPKYVVPEIVGYLNGKSTEAVALQYGDKTMKNLNGEFVNIF